jgi:hypothetical protein
MNPAESQSPQKPIAKSSHGERGGPSRIVASYRFARAVSYSICLGVLAGCAFAPATVPANAVVAARVPASWSPAPANPNADPTIVGARFSSLDVELGQDWDGDVVTSRDVASVDLHTNLFDIALARTAPGRFHFLQHVIDDPAFIVRPYALEIIAKRERGDFVKLVVPFRLRGHGVPPLAVNR